LKRVLAGLTISAASAALGAVAYAAEIPSWAYPLNPPGGGATQAASDDKTLYEVPDSAVKLTKAQIGGRPVVPDWHPGDHPAMPDIVAKGRGNDVRACGFCHQPSGVGRPENAALAVVIRDSKVIIPQPDDVLDAGDEMLFFAGSAVQNQVRALIDGAVRPRP